jgi:DNA mismatch repair ATPase MutS
MFHSLSVYVTIFFFLCRKVHKNKISGMSKHSDCAQQHSLAPQMDISHSRVQLPSEIQSTNDKVLQDSPHKFTSKENGVRAVENLTPEDAHAIATVVKKYVSKAEDMNKQQISEYKTQTAASETGIQSKDQLMGEVDLMVDLTETKKRRHKCVPTVTTYRLNK